MVFRPLRHKRAVFEDAQCKCFEVEGGKSGIKWTDEIFVKPLRFFDLETNSLDRFELFSGQVDNETSA